MSERQLPENAIANLSEWTDLTPQQVQAVLECVEPSETAKDTAEELLKKTDAMSQASDSVRAEAARIVHVLGGLDAVTEVADWQFPEVWLHLRAVSIDAAINGLPEVD